MNDESLITPDADQVAHPKGDGPFGAKDAAGQTTDAGKAKIFPCEECGADLVFNIGEQALKCPFCGHVKQIAIAEDAVIVEQDFHTMLQRMKDVREKKLDAQPEHSEVRCESCGANVIFAGTLTSSECPYCGSPIQRENVHTATWRVPVDGVLPFLVDHGTAATRLKEWVKSRWFAPNEFKKRGADGKFEGVYLPYWTYDSLTFNAYSGERGEHYYVTVGSGKDKRQERRTRWYPASGKFQRFFDDVLICGLLGMPEKYIRALEPWPHEKCMPFTQQVLAGHFARTYDVELEDGFGSAKKIMDAAIHSEARQLIGGDEQRVHSVKSRFDAITFKHLLLPLWLLVYRLHDKSYRVFINAGTGEVQGERPYSWVKIVGLILLILAVILGIGAARGAFR